MAEALIGGLATGVGGAAVGALMGGGGGGGGGGQQVIRTEAQSTPSLLTNLALMS